MKKWFYLFAFIGIFSITITGCGHPNSFENEEQFINVLKRNGAENKYKVFKKITKDKQVQKVKDVLDNIDWDKGKVDMPRPADYKFFFQFKNANIQAKPITYDLWISDNKSTVELVMDAGSNYVHLNKEESAKLVEILTGRNLSDLITLSDKI